MSDIYSDETDYSALVTVLAKPGEKIIEEMTPKKAHALHMAVGISGESGELLDAIKKWVVYGKSLDVDNVIEELGDIEFYMQGVRDSLGISREQIIKTNMAKLNQRYHSGSYSDAQAQERADK